MTEKKHKVAFSKKNRLHILILCLAGLLINVLAAKLPWLLGVPLYLDNIGSALVAALGGYIPGIIVGFFTNFINGIGNIDTFYYSGLTILIAISSAFFARRGDYDRPKRLPLIILVFTLIGGALGSLITWTIYGFSFGDTVSAPLAYAFYENGGMNRFLAQFSADMLVDLADKTITVLAVYLVLKLLPAGLRQKLELKGWKQSPRPLRERMTNTGTEYRHSLRMRVVLLMISATLVMGIAVTTISCVNFRKSSIEEQKHLAQGVADVIREHIDPERVDEYLEKGEEAEGYSEIKSVMKTLMDSSGYIEFCYVYRIMEDGCHVVFDPDTDDVPGEKAGTVIPFDNAFADQLPALLAGEEIGAIDSNETYGWLLTLYQPVYNSGGKCQCYIGVDINMEHISGAVLQFLARVILLFISFLLIILTVALWLADYHVISPINSMAATTHLFDFRTEESREEALRSIRSLDIHTDDEIEHLYDALVDTTEEMLANIAEMQRQNDTINRLQNGLIMVLADMVESRDQNTGDHVRKTAAYTEIIMRELKKEHIYEDQLTEDFIRDVVNSAPLHDVGKIHVPDAILNKPGKLTDGEFERMKGHTTAGSEIITSAMNTVSDAQSSYLQEARNLAQYHHEKWNGSGYPEGLKGEEIPLSARVMAVADVFDALVSRRSYKEPFSFEKAMDIIREGSGSHFDPNVAQAFIHAEDEVRRVMNTYMGN